MAPLEAQRSQIDLIIFTPFRAQIFMVAVKQKKNLNKLRSSICDKYVTWPSVQPSALVVYINPDRFGDSASTLI